MNRDSGNADSTESVSGNGCGNHDVENSFCFLGGHVCVVTMKMGVEWWNGDMRGREGIS